MAGRQNALNAAPAQPKWWHAIGQNTTVAAASAFATALVGVGVTQLSGTDTAKAVAAPQQIEIERQQQAMWGKNPNCSGDLKPLWLETKDARKIDVTVCPSTGDLFVQMEDETGRRIQHWFEMKPVHDKFRAPEQSAAWAGELLIGTARAAKGGGFTPIPRSLHAQNVVCQFMFPDGTLRRRIASGNGQCVELTINSRTGEVISQRPVPCNPNCQANV